MIRLVTHSKVPPGEFFIKVLLRGTDVSLVYGPCAGTEGCFVFGPSPDIKDVAQKYSDFLKGNSLPGSEFATCLKQLDDYTCTRLGGNNRWCYDSNADYSTSTRAILAQTGGGCCGAKL